MTSDANVKNIKMSIVISEFNAKIIERLLFGAKKAYLHHGCLDENLKIFRVPGAFEIPGTISMLLRNLKMDAIIALGAVIKGETSHFNFIAKESSHGIAELSRNADIPIINGILTTDDARQAMNRSSSNGCNKGWDAMEAALQTISVYKDIKTYS